MRQLMGEDESSAFGRKVFIYDYQLRFLAFESDAVYTLQILFAKLYAEFFDEGGHIDRNFLRIEMFEQ
jgi:hypothetical protein